MTEIYLAAGIFMVGTFFVMAYLMSKGFDIPIMFLSLTFVWTMVAIILFFITGVGNDPLTMLNNIWDVGVKKSAANVLQIFISMLFITSLARLGIVEYIIRKAVELGGGKAIVSTLIVGFVILYIFTGLGWNYNLFFVVYVMCLPVLTSYGLDKMDSSFLTVVAVFAGYFIAPIAIVRYWGRYWLGPTDYPVADYQIWMMGGGALIFGIMYVGYGLVKLRMAQSRRMWAVDTGPGTQLESEPFKDRLIANMPWYAFLTPAIPVVLVWVFQWTIIPSMLAGHLYVYAITWRLRGQSFKENVDLWWSVLIEGITSTIPLTFMFIGYTTLFSTLGETVIANSFQQVVGPILPTTTISIFLMTTIFMPTDFFRGLLDPWGFGGILIAGWLAEGSISTQIQIAAFSGPYVSHHLADPSHSSNIWFQGTQGIPWGAWMKRLYPMIWGVGAAVNAWSYFALTQGWIPGVTFPLP
jgi:hypothetical protein